VFIRVYPWLKMANSPGARQRGMTKTSKRDKTRQNATKSATPLQNPCPEVIAASAPSGKRTYLSHNLNHAPVKMGNQ